jgi:hypothetical protein
MLSSASESSATLPVKTQATYFSPKTTNAMAMLIAATRMAKMEVFLSLSIAADLIMIESGGSSFNIKFPIIFEQVIVSCDKLVS